MKNEKRLNQVLRREKFMAIVMNEAGEPIAFSRFKSKVVTLRQEKKKTILTFTLELEPA